MSDLPSLSVVIPVRNGARTIARQLDALMVQETDFTWDIVIADNGSTDDTKTLCEGHPISALVPLQVVDASQFIGVNHARNRGVECAQSDLIVFCDSDDAVRPGWLNAHYIGLSANEKVVTAGPVEVESLADVDSTRSVPVPVKPRTTGGFEHGLGANFGFRRSVWTDIGGFSNEFRGGFDEVEFMIRAQKNGSTFVWLGDAVVDYTIPTSFRTALRRKYRHGRMRPTMSRLHGDAVPPISTLRAAVRIIRHLPAAIAEPRSGRRFQRFEMVAYNAGIIVGMFRRRGRAG